jgi:hypothetical protein
LLPLSLFQKSDQNQPNARSQTKVTAALLHAQGVWGFVRGLGFAPNDFLFVQADFACIVEGVAYFCVLKRLACAGGGA